MILALKTADFNTQIWLYDNIDTPRPSAQLEWESGRQLSEQLIGRIIELIERHGHQMEDLSGIIIFSGPGSFTSLRIGHATVNALADSLGIPVVGSQSEDWIVTGRSALKTATPGRPALPHYGAEANITKPKS